MEAFVKDDAAEKELGIPGTNAAMQAAFLTLRQWVLEARAADKAHTAALLDQANLSSS